MTLSLDGKRRFNEKKQMGDMRGAWRGLHIAQFNICRCKNSIKIILTTLTGNRSAEQWTLYYEDEGFPA